MELLILYMYEKVKQFIRVYVIANTFRTKIIEFVYFTKTLLNQISKICQ